MLDLNLILQRDSELCKSRLFYMKKDQSPVVSASAITFLVGTLFTVGSSHLSVA